MEKPGNSLPEDYFNDVYRNNEDPWEFETSEYEINKYRTTVGALPRKSYKSAFEIGCSIGVLSELLAGKCEKLLAVDVAEAPLVKARVRLKNLSQVEFKKLAVPDQFPTGQFDLIVVSEVAYYLAWPDFHLLQEKILKHLEQKGHLLLVHWTPIVHDYPLTGDEVHDDFMKLAGDNQPLRHLHGQREQTYRLDLFEKH
ncbi:SAM-dependent methyltransferase [Dyadobacter psychrotolerans]|uniref:Methyltransferase n=1 Tax=Dyadobacter psychrotolerans TaxID=2541721 RepID=A0A4R5DDX9_9BACT|nr:SAM-dependent methyltransferase [Dyadobacter psychrotolerans]TDE11277.1 methyltransferase [Dyadobacter psychrotolerans]